MKIATAAYDKNSVLVAPPKFYNKEHPEQSKFTIEGGYWHTVIKRYADEWTRNAMAKEMLETISARNGTCIRENMGVQRQGEDVSYWVRLIYVIEEPDHVPFKAMAATADRKGIDPDFVYPEDGVAEYGPDYRTPRNATEAYRAAAAVEPYEIDPLPSALPQTSNRPQLLYVPSMLEEPEFS